MRLCAVLLVMLLSGCFATVPRLQPNGQRLEATIASNRTTFYRGDRRYAPGQYQWLRSLRQGDAPIDDELDFYAAAGASDRVATLIAWREQRNRALAITWGGEAIGLGLLGAGIAMLVSQLNTPGATSGDLLTQPQGQLSMGLIGAGSIVMATAPLLLFRLFAPKAAIHTEFDDGGGFTYTLLFSREDAVRTAEAFNRRLER